MTADERSDAEPKGEEVSPPSGEEIAESPDDNEFPKSGPAGDMTSDPESLARRPQTDGGDVGDTGKSNIGAGEEGRRSP